MKVYGYFGTSIKGKDPNRAKQEMILLARKMGKTVSCWFLESESWIKLQKPELFRALQATNTGDVLFIDQVRRISRLNTTDWEILKRKVTDKGLNIVSLDIPTSYQLMKSGDEFTDRMFPALNTMMLDMLEAVVRKDYEENRRRQALGVQGAKLAGKYKGRPEDLILHAKIRGLLIDDKSYNYIQYLLGCSRHTISKVKKRMVL